jgi:hypothetical protein
LICISFMVRDGECFLAIWASSFEKALFSSFAHSLSHWFFFGSLVFWPLYIFWLSTPCLMYSWQRFSPILWITSSVLRPFLLLCRSFLIWFSTICWSFLLVAEPLELYWGTHCLCLLPLLYSLLFPILASRFQVLY